MGRKGLRYRVLKGKGGMQGQGQGQGSNFQHIWELQLSEGMSGRGGGHPDRTANGYQRDLGGGGKK